MEGIIMPRSKSVRIKPVSINEVKNEGFFYPYIKRNRTISIPLLYKLFEKYGTIENFRIAAGISNKEITRRLAPDSDLYKWMEAIAWDLQSFPDRNRTKQLDKFIDLIAKAQEKSGYIDTYYTGLFRKERFKRLEYSHELYCGGHLIQAAIAHFRSTGKENFLQIAKKWANYIVKKYEKKEIVVNDGHPEVEMALVELYRTTGDEKYLKLAGTLMEMPYVYLGNKKFLEINEITGHAVRMMYLLSGATDYYLETRDPRYYKKIKQLAEDLYAGKYYITGGIGSRYQGEAFGFKYELPNLRAYCETCASIALMMWLYRMFFVEQDVKWFNLFERVLYNAFLASVSLDGREYFYVNPLASYGSYRRQNWYRTTCCPPNFQRFIASLPAYFYAKGKNEIWVNLYDTNQAKLKLADENTVLVDMKTDYPWSGKVKIDIKKHNNDRIKIHLRIPEWSDKTEVRFDDKVFNAEKSSYFTLEISQSCSIDIEFDVKAEIYHSNPAVESDKNCVAICRGPLVYCLEGVDNNFDLFNFFLPQQCFQQQRDENFFNFVTVHGYGFLNTDTDFLYRKGTPHYRFKEVKFKAVPYFSWANRKKSSMILWIGSFKGTE
ncbi:MAG: glycoside hydrolase family 127 protein [Candidatus Omnitrophica bacterium]|nr:glycoside hydrolase family 127 protein [Candidatus Omnitrophota bacterium]